MKKSLHSPEWTFLTALLLVICSVVATAKISAFRAASIVKETDFEVEDILVQVKGAVKRGGSFRVAPGTRLIEVVKKAKPLAFADLQKLPLELRVDEPLEVVIEELKEIVIKVCGAVEETELRLPTGSRLCDLKGKVVLKDGADKSIFRRRKRLKNGEVIEVTKKGIE